LLRNSKQNIALTGFMAVGKSAVGRTLARRLKRRFVDLDRAIEKVTGLPVRQIFDQLGEPGFRKLEKETLARVLAEEGQVIATGGGVVMDEENLQLLREKTLLICLTASTDVLLKRAGNGAKRPLLKGTNRRRRIEELLQQREKKYALAHSSVDTTDLTVDQVVDKIIELLKVES
jgi:shikimate kinase